MNKLYESIQKNCYLQDAIFFSIDDLNLTPLDAEPSCSISKYQGFKLPSGLSLNQSDLNKIKFTDQEDKYLLNLMQAEEKGWITKDKYTELEEQLFALKYTQTIINELKNKSNAQEFEYQIEDLIIAFDNKIFFFEAGANGEFGTIIKTRVGVKTNATEEIQKIVEEYIADKVERAISLRRREWIKYDPDDTLCLIIQKASKNNVEDINIFNAEEESLILSIAESACQTTINCTAAFDFTIETCMSVLDNADKDFSQNMINATKALFSQVNYQSHLPVEKANVIDAGFGSLSSSDTTLDEQQPPSEMTILGVAPDYSSDDPPALKKEEALPSKNTLLQSSPEDLLRDATQPIAADIFSSRISGAIDSSTMFGQQFLTKSKTLWRIIKIVFTTTIFFAGYLAASLVVVLLTGYGLGLISNVLYPIVLLVISFAFALQTHKP